ncbi:SAM-dependent methyltransferase [Pectobacterium phage Arno160]|uniref:Uncharacterized protein n=1 Tax=Pectobacterium phage Arno160 TaxID=2488835 RepID=A0A3G8F1Z2_9CAUD|nr:SAM-dependent methyltransferase [Pectobacterium phage Arno160]AZF88066.1 hypothetical protein Arno160_gp04 [Pectobacterium phage Arno160]
MQILISAMRNGLSAAHNSERSCELVARIVKAGYSVEVGHGVYQETDAAEASYEVVLNVLIPHTCDVPVESLSVIIQEWAIMARENYQQDCVGVLHNGLFYLAYPGKPASLIGRFTEFPERPTGHATFIHGKWYKAVPL